MRVVGKKKNAFYKKMDTAGNHYFFLSGWNHERVHPINYMNIPSHAIPRPLSSYCTL